MIEIAEADVLMWLVWAMGDPNLSKCAEDGIWLVVSTINNKCDDFSQLQHMLEDEQVRTQHQSMVADLFKKWFLYLWERLSSAFLAVPSLESESSNKIQLAQFLPYHFSTTAETEKVKITRHGLRALSALLKLIGPHLYAFVPKVLATLKQASTDSKTRADVCEVWKTFVETLERPHLGQSLSQIVVSLLPYVESAECVFLGNHANKLYPCTCVACASSVVSNKICLILDYLLVTKRSELRDHFKDIPFLPSGIRMLDPIRLQVEAEIGEVSFSDRVGHLIRLMSHESSDVRAQVLNQLKLYIRENRTLFITQTLEGSFGKLIGKLVSALLSTCSDSSQIVKLACCDCIGEFGAIDPGHMATVLDDDLESSAMRRRNESNDYRFAADIIQNVLVKALRAHTHSQSQDRALFAIQELLKYCGCKPESIELAVAFEQQYPQRVKLYQNALASTGKSNTPSSHLVKLYSSSELDVSNFRRLSSNAEIRASQIQAMSLWLSFATDVRSLIHPCLFSNYAIQDKGNESRKRKKTLSQIKPFYNPIISVRKWLADWTRHLIDHSNGSRSRVFRTCRTLVRTDSRTASYLLPFLVENVLSYGNPEDLHRIEIEILTVLDSAGLGGGNQSSTQFSSESAQTIFELLDLLNWWIDDKPTKSTHSTPKKVGNKRETRSSARKSKANSSDHKGSNVGNEDEEHRPLHDKKHILSRIPKKIIAQAAFRCKAYTRALMLFEQHLREETAKKIKQPIAKVTNKNKKNKGTFGECYLGVLGIGHSPVSEEDLRFLQQVYSGIDDPDGMKGIVSLRSTAPSLPEQIMDYETRGAWTDALTCYEQLLQTEPEKVAHHQGYLKSLRHLGNHKTAITYIRGVASHSSQDVCKVLSEDGVAAAWRLSDWNLVHDFLAAEPSEANFEVGLSRVLYALHINDSVAYHQNLQNTRLMIMNPLSAASRESYNRAHPYFLQLHMLQDIEQIKQLLGMPQEFLSTMIVNGESPPLMSAENDVKLRDLLGLWDARVERTHPSFPVRESILSLRRVLLTEYGCQREIGEAWLHLAKVAREAKQLETASGALHHAGRQQILSLQTCIEHAKLLRDKGRFHEALLYLEKNQNQKMQRDSNSMSLSSIPKTVSNNHGASSLLLMGKWMQESGVKEAKEIIDIYRRAIHLQPYWEKGHFVLGKYWDKIMSNNLNQRDLKSVKMFFERKNLNVEDVNAMKCLTKALTNYGTSLSKGHHYIFQSLPRMLTLWFDFGEHWNPKTSRNKNPKINEINTQFLKSHQTMLQILDKTAAFQWLTALPQIISRICHPNTEIFGFIKKVIAKIFCEYPQQALWMVASVRNSQDSTRQNCARKIMHEVKQIVNPEILHIINNGLNLFNGLIGICKFKKGKKKTVSMASKFPKLRNLDTSNPIMMPLQSQLTIRLPPSKPTETNNIPREVKGFQDHQVSISGFDDTIEIIRSKAKPVKITMLGSDGRRYKFLCKEEKSGDMRKDFRMMHINTVINRLFRKHPDARQRKLRLRTYAVLTLTEDCGLIEWVPQTTGFRHLVNRLHDKGNHVADIHAIKAQMDKCKNEMELLNVFLKVCEVLPPVFHQWFLQNFPDPATWFTNRLCYTRSAAVWSMVGYIIGLGDRHGENILIDESNGECIHVDFDCLFGKGEGLECPEVVPFRLTPNIVDAFGVTGVTGVYQSVCEISLDVLRANHETLMNVLHTFIHDPLVEWKHERHSSEKPARSIRHMERLEKKLKGTENLSLALSAKGQVQQLIKIATKTENLSKMYIGWMSWL